MSHEEDCGCDSCTVEPFQKRITTLTAALEEAKDYIARDYCECSLGCTCRRCAALATIEKALSEGERKP